MQNIFKEYEKQFDVFESEVKYGMKNISLHYTINTLGKNNEIALNSTPEFWNYTLYNLATISILTLGRIFDVNAEYSINKLFDLLGKSLDYFSFDNIRERKEWNCTDEEYEEYLKDKKAFELMDYRRLREIKKRVQKMYDSIYKQYRHSIIAHRLILDTAEIDSGGKFKYIDILEIYIELYNIQNELWERAFNGRKGKKLTFEILNDQVENLHDFTNGTPEYIYILRDFEKILGLLNANR